MGSSTAQMFKNQVSGPTWTFCFWRPLVKLGDTTERLTVTTKWNILLNSKGDNQTSGWRPFSGVSIQTSWWHSIIINMGKEWCDRGLLLLLWSNSTLPPKKKHVQSPCHLSYVSDQNPSSTFYSFSITIKTGDLINTVFQPLCGLRITCYKSKELIKKTDRLGYTHTMINTLMLYKKK